MTRSRNWKSLLIIGIVILLCGVVPSTAFSLYTEPTLIPYGEENTSDSDNCVYEMRDIMVIDKYGTTTYDNGDPEEDYYIVAYYVDDSDNAQLASFMIDSSDGELFNEMNDYIDDDTAYIGDYFINACVTVSSQSDLDSDIQSYYHEAEDYYVENFDQVDKTDIHFEYYCDSADDFPAAAELEKKVVKIASIFSYVITAFGIVCIIVAIQRRKIEKAAMANMPPQPPVYYVPNQQLNNQQPNNQQPNQDTYYTPPQNSEGNNYNDSRSDTSSGNDYQN